MSAPAGRVETKVPAVEPVICSLNYTSVSALQKLSHDEYGGCNTRWWLKYKKLQKEEQTGQQKVGIEGHSQVEHYLPTGEDVLGPIAAAGKYLLPQPGPDIRVEWGLNDRPRPPDVDVIVKPALLDPQGRVLEPAVTEKEQVNHYPLDQARLHADGLPLLGFMDWINPRGWYVSPEGVWTRDPANTIEVGDNKFIGNTDYAKKEAELKDSTQMSGYGRFLINVVPGLKYVRVSHNSFQTKNKKRAVKTTALMTVDEVRRVWERRGDAVVKHMRLVAKIEKEADVPANLNSCRAFGKLCDFTAQCSKFKKQSPIDLLKAQFTPNGAQPKMASLSDKVRNLNGSSGTPAAGGTPWIPDAAPVAQPVAVQTQATAANAVSGQQYRFSTGAIGKFISAVDRGGGDIVFSFVQVGADGNAAGQPFFVAAAEPVTLVAPPAAALPPAPPAGPPAATATATVAAAAAPAPSLMRARRAQTQIVDVETPAVEREPDAPPPPASLATQVAPAPKRGTKKATGSGVLRLFIGCVPSSAFESLDGYVADVLGAMQELHKVDDIRFPPDANHPLAFDRWTGALAAAVRASPPPPGDYVAFRGSKVFDVVVEALVPLCAPGNVTRAL